MQNQLRQSLTGIPRTMLMTTRARVEEHQRSDAIFQDPKVSEWWRHLSWDADLDHFYTPIAQLTWAVRAHLFDQSNLIALNRRDDETSLEKPFINWRSNR